KAIEIKLQWRKDNYPPPLADEMNADMIAIAAMARIKACREPEGGSPLPLLQGETED
ncbi:unnamed protein product, partial [marine sediment metagenome]